MAKLFDPLDISNTAVHLRNRVVMPPMNMDDAGPDGIATTDVVEHYVARAEGGVGLVIVAASYVREDGRLSPHQLGISGDHQLEGLRRLAHSIKEHGAAAAIQIHHAGGVAKPDNIGGPPIAPSAGAFPNVPRDLTTAEIHGLVEAFAAAAGRAKAVGFDAVELHGAHGFLLTQFLSPATNHRTDAYGGDLEGRLRFALECVQAIRKTAGADYPLIVRINAQEDRPGGITLEDGCSTAQALADAGAHVIHVSGGLSSDAARKPGYMVPLAEAVKRVVSVPVIAVGRLSDPVVANRVIEDGKADLVAVGTQMLKQADWARAAASALGQELRR
jgi:NADPH2 dehydrogenase